MLTAFDVAVGFLVLISAILATARGLTREVLSLVTWAGSAIIAWWMLQYHPEIARGMIREEIVADVVTVIGTFIVSLIVLHLITMRIADFVVDSKIGPLDRSLGFVFGALRGVLIAAVLVVGGNILHWGGLGDYVEDSKTIPPLEKIGYGVMDALLTVLPQGLEEALSKMIHPDEEGTTDTAPAEEGTDAGESGLNT